MDRDPEGNNFFERVVGSTKRFFTRTRGGEDTELPEIPEEIKEKMVEISRATKYAKTFLNMAECAYNRVEGYNQAFQRVTADSDKEWVVRIVNNSADAIDKIVENAREKSVTTRQAPRNSI